jgi:hypothetical protein
MELLKEKRFNMLKENMKRMKKNKKVSEVEIEYKMMNMLK